MFDVSAPHGGLRRLGQLVSLDHVPIKVKECKGHISATKGLTKLWHNSNNNSRYDMYIYIYYIYIYYIYIYMYIIYISIYYMILNYIYIL